MKTENITPEDKKALIIAQFMTAACILLAIITLFFVGLYLKQINDQDKRTEYIQELHSELK